MLPTPEGAGPRKRPRVLVTRPQPQADEWVVRLQALGLQASALPLLGIADAADPAAVAAAWADVPAQDLVMFVSPSAVERFFGQRPAAAAGASAWPTGAWAGSTGPGTARALRQAGVPAGAVISPSEAAGTFDSEALWRELKPRRSWQGARALIVRGEGGRDWLADTLRAEGAQVQFVEAYRRTAPALDAASREALDHALAVPAASVWLFSSSEAVGHLPALAPAADWSRAQALATHPRIAAAARALGFGRVRQIAPSPQAVADALAESEAAAG